MCCTFVSPVSLCLEIHASQRIAAMQRVLTRACKHSIVTSELGVCIPKISATWRFLKQSPVILKSRGRVLSLITPPICQTMDHSSRSLIAKGLTASDWRRQTSLWGHVTTIMNTRGAWSGMARPSRSSATTWFNLRICRTRIHATTASPNLSHSRIYQGNFAGWKELSKIWWSRFLVIWTLETFLRKYKEAIRNENNICACINASIQKFFNDIFHKSNRQNI